MTYYYLSFFTTTCKLSHCHVEFHHQPLLHLRCQVCIVSFTIVHIPLAFTAVIICIIGNMGGLRVVIGSLIMCVLISLEFRRAGCQCCTWIVIYFHTQYSNRRLTSFFIQHVFQEEHNSDILSLIFVCIDCHYYCANNPSSFYCLLSFLRFPNLDDVFTDILSARSSRLFFPGRSSLRRDDTNCNCGGIRMS